MLAMMKNRLRTESAEILVDMCGVNKNEHRALYPIKTFQKVELRNVPASVVRVEISPTHR